VEARSFNVEPRSLAIKPLSFTIEPHSLEGEVPSFNDEALSLGNRRQRAISNKATMPGDPPGNTRPRWLPTGAVPRQEHLHRALGHGLLPGLAQRRLAHGELRPEGEALDQGFQLGGGEGGVGG